MAGERWRSVVGRWLTPFSDKAARQSGHDASAEWSRDYAPRSDWTKNRGRLNYSSFVFLDVNRDGQYSLGDRPMGGIMVRVSREPDGRALASVRTNLNGFANFATSATKRKKVPISAPGRYRFAVSVPDGWIATTGNQVQVKDFLLTPGSPSGIGAADMVRPVGLAPERAVRGRRAAGTALSIAALRGAEVLARTEIADEGPFRLRLPETAEALAVSAGAFESRIELAACPVDLGTVDAERRPLRPGLTVETIDFDGVTPRGLRKVPNGYAGLNWFNLNAMSRDFTAGSQGYVNGNTSGDHIAYTSSGYPAELWSDAPFDFVGVALSSAWLRAEGEVGTIEAWRGSELIARDEIVLSALCPVRYTPMLPEVTRLRFSTVHYWQMVIDDITIAR